nr:immunoglobulin heavy chain junction region [Mus musculus]MBK4196738.1 immunoglobulin heavy chain junction region [Mus musculus]MBK4196739.1 immunoglobulin heavy chain junction region [Mus musculus]MBK4196740.1 immunoglobulin heavy chain junction region [Mus musculus]
CAREGRYDYGFDYW